MIEKIKQKIKDLETVYNSKIEQLKNLNTQTQTIALEINQIKAQHKALEDLLIEDKTNINEIIPAH